MRVKDPNALVLYFLVQGNILHADLWPLYLGASCFSLCGALCGDALSKKMDQGLFRMFMLGLMTCCCALLLVAGLGKEAEVGATPPQASWPYATAS